MLRRNQPTGPEEWEGVFSWELEIQNKVKKAAQTSSNDPDGVFVLMYGYVSIQEPGARSNELRSVSRGILHGALGS